MRLTLLLLALAAFAHAEVVPGRYIVELTGDSVSQHLARRARRESLRGAEAANRHTAIRTEQAPSAGASGPRSPSRTASKTSPIPC